MPWPVWRRVIAKLSELGCPRNTGSLDKALWCGGAE
jgi:hypothetical protein